MCETPLRCRAGQRWVPLARQSESTWGDKTWRGNTVAGNKHRPRGRLSELSAPSLSSFVHASIFSPATSGRGSHTRIKEVTTSGGKGGSGELRGKRSTGAGLAGGGLAEGRMSRGKEESEQRPRGRKTPGVGRSPAAKAPYFSGGSRTREPKATSTEEAACICASAPTVTLQLPLSSPGTITPRPPPRSGRPGNGKSQQALGAESDLSPERRQDLGQRFSISVHPWIPLFT